MSRWIYFLFYLLFSNASAHGAIFVLNAPFGSSIGSINEQGCKKVVLYPGEWGYVFFNIHLEGSQHNGRYRIVRESEAPKSRLYVSVEWEQLQHSAYGRKKPQWSSVRELLLSQNVVPNEGQWIDGKYIAPLVLDVSNSIDITRDGSDKALVLLRIETDVNTKSGNYLYNVTSLDNADTLKICVSVVETKLPESKKIKGIYYRGRLDPSYPEYVGVQELNKELDDLRLHGFNSISILNQSLESRKKLLSIAREKGLSEAFPMQIPTRLLRERELPVDWLAMLNTDSIYIMGVDEPDRPIEFRKHLQKSEFIHNFGFKVFTAMKAETAKKIPRNNKTDWVNYQLKSWRTAKEMHEVSSKSQINTYYWQSYLERPALNRLYSGFFLFWSGFDGIFPYVYKHVVIDATPYESDWANYNNQNKVNRKQYYSVYPSSNGPVPTMQWEAFRLGDDDLRHAQLLDIRLADLVSSGEILREKSIREEFTLRLSKLVDRYSFRGSEPYVLYGSDLAVELMELRDWIKERISDIEGL